VIGPGSLYTSIMPSLLLPGLLAAVGVVAGGQAVRLQRGDAAGETQGYDLADHLAALERHTGAGWIDVVLANNRFDARRPGGYAASGGEAALAAGHDPADRRRRASSWRTSWIRTTPTTTTRPELAAAVMHVYERESFGRRRSRVSRTA
jgi:hypothetical protein